MAFQRRASDADLMARVRAGDAVSDDELYRRHIENAQRVARIVASSGEEEADDLAEEAFIRAFAQLREGGGPDGEFAPYLRTLVRRLAADRHRTGVAGTDHGGPPSDVGGVRTAHPMVRQAYETLPPRWQQVLWLSEVEGEPPATLGAAFDTTPDAAAALAYRAREGLRRAYLGLHVARAAREECKALGAKVAALARGVMDAGDRPAVEAHLGDCAECRDRYEEMLLMVSDLPGILVPALIGVAAPSRVAASATALPAAGGSATAATAVAPVAADDRVPRSPGRREPRRRRAGNGVMAGTLAAATVAVLAFAVVLANVGAPSDETAGPPPAGADTPSDESARVSLETASPRTSETSAADESVTADQTQEPGEESTSGADQSPAQDSDSDSESESQQSRQDPATGDGSPATGSAGAETAAPDDEGEAEEQAPGGQSDASTGESPAPSELDSSDAAALRAAAEDDDPPSWWCQAVPWWPTCSGGDDSSGPGESAEQDGGPPADVPPGLSRNGLCEWLPDMPPCSSAERDRQRGASER